MSPSSLAEPASNATKCCSHCGAVARDASVPWCRKCGFHPQFNRVIELADYDLEQQPPEAGPTRPTAAEGVKYILRAIPSWAWKVALGLLLVLIVSLAVKFTTTPHTTTRVVCVVTQLVLGKLALLTAHFWCYLYGVTESDRFALIDVFIRPIAVWGPTIRDIQIGRAWWRVALLTWGAGAEVLAVSLVGGVAWERIWEAGPREPPKKNLLAAVTEEAQRNARDADSLEDALAQVEGQGKPKKDDKTPLVRRQFTDCLVIGYLPRPRTEGEPAATDAAGFVSLILATEVDGKLRYAGVVQSGVPPEAREFLEARLSTIGARDPLVPCPLPGNWVRPVVTCRVSYAQWNKQKLLVETRFEKLLAEIETKAR